MSVSAIENLTEVPTGRKTPSPEVLRRTAEQFEAILLMQLTSSLNSSSEVSSGDDNDALFGGDGGSDLAKKMFSEQLATSMAQSGGVGLADMIMRQLGGVDAPKKTTASKSFSSAASAFKDIKTDGKNENFGKLPTARTSAPLINKNGKINPVKNIFTGNPNEFEVVSRYEDQYPTETYNATSDSGSQFMPDLKDSVNPVSNELSTIFSSDSIKSVAAPNAIKSAETSANSVKVEFQMPVAGGRISSDFGSRFHPVDRKTKFHGGIDIAVPIGTKVAAAAAGVVKFAGWKGGYGNVVIIEHADGTETLYGHNQKLLVKEGQTVTAGEQISLSGSTGKSTGPHLHFEVRRNGQLVNPRKFLSNVVGNKADK